MMLMPSADGFITRLQEAGNAVATVTSSDDLAIVIPAILKHIEPAGLKVRIYMGQADRTLLVVVM